MGCMSAGLRDFFAGSEGGWYHGEFVFVSSSQFAVGRRFFYAKNFVPHREVKTEHRFL